MFLLYSALDENFSWYLDDNIRTFTDGQVDKQDSDFVESNIMRCKYMKKSYAANSHEHHYCGGKQGKLFDHLRIRINTFFRYSYVRSMF